MIAARRGFNSIKVRLELMISVSPLLTLRGFNSIKVRLERERNKEKEINDYLFQFHKGTIRTSGSGAEADGYMRFQFHKGTIRTSISQFDSSSTTEFQFHKGTIRTTPRARR